MKKQKIENKKTKKKASKKNNGITLIALVITIIVLLILAGVSIATLTGDNGILTRASEANERTKEANADEQVKLAVTASIGTDGKINLDNLNNELKKIDNLTYNGSPISDDNKIESLPATVTVDGYDVTINGNGSVAGKTEEKVVDSVTIPDGFYYVGGTKDTGLVISDDPSDENAYKDQETVGTDLQGNQFVWVPVDYSQFERRAGFWDGGPDGKYFFPGCEEADSTGVNSKVTETVTTQEEAQKMYSSVEKNGGFYIGRYETGKDSNGNVVVKQGVDVYNEIQWSANGEMQETEGTTGGAVEISRNFDIANKYTSVTSTLIYGVQWDAVMKWMENIENPNATGSLTKYIQDSTEMGWYNKGDIHQTGIDVDNNKSNCVNNIYDLSGNVEEWTMESSGTDGRVNRGGNCFCSGSNSPACNREGYVPSSVRNIIGFRLTLCLNG